MFKKSTEYKQCGVYQNVELSQYAEQSIFGGTGWKNETAIYDTR